VLGLVSAASLATAVAPRDVHADDRSLSWRDVFPSPSRTVLLNGLSIVVDEDHRTPIVSMVLRYRAGYRNEPLRKEGLASLTNDMMHEATKHIPKGHALRILDRAGATRWGSTESDDMVAGVTISSNQVALPLWVWSDQMGFFVERADQELLDSQRRLIEADRRAKVEGVENGRVSAIIAKELYPGDHPYGHDAFGDPSTLAALTVADVRAFHQKWLAPNNATLVVSGDVRASDFVALAEGYFGPIARSPDVDFKSPPTPELPGEVHLTINANVSRASVIVEWPTPAWLAPGDAELDVAANLLGGKRTPFLYWSLVDKKKIAVTLSAWQWSRQLASAFRVTASTADGHTADEVVAAIDETIATIVAKEPSALVRDRAVDETLERPIFDLEQPSVRAGRFAAFEQIAGTADFLGRNIERYANASSEQIRAAIAKYLTSKRRVIAVVTPSTSAPVCGELAARNVVEVSAP
jgi:predicted Zn-dependent peptidase